jgi:hypothetical protein
MTAAMACISRNDAALHEHWWARTVSNRRPLVCKSELDCLLRLKQCRSVLKRPVQGWLVSSVSTECRGVFARLGTLLAQREPLMLQRF